MSSAEQANIAIAKFGGSSMANPEQVAAQLAYPGNEAPVVVVSAPGVSEQHEQKLTIELLSLGASPRKSAAAPIQERFASIYIADQHGRASVEIEEIIEGIPDDLTEWAKKGWPVAALGEYWSARMFAAYSGRQFVDARELVRVSRKGRLDVPASIKAMSQRLVLGEPTVTPGYYGADRRGRVHLLGPGTSDVPGALAARALRAGRYDNWSDVDGLKTTDPKTVEVVHDAPEITYREVRELAHGGCELLHPTVTQILGDSAIQTFLRNTYGAPDNVGTIVSQTRDWSGSAIVSVTGRSDIQELSLYEFGLDVAVGATVEAYRLLLKKRIPYHDVTTGVDDVSIFVLDEYSSKLKKVQRGLIGNGRTADTRPVGLVHIVGEGLQSGSERGHIIGQVTLAFAEQNIDVLGVTGGGRGASLSIYTPAEDVSSGYAIDVAHRAVWPAVA